MTISSRRSEALKSQESVLLSGWRGWSPYCQRIKSLSHIRICSLPLWEKSLLRKLTESINQLHLDGIRAELDYEGKSLKSQMRRADKLKARYVLILGEDELKRGKAVLRNMETKSQEEISIDKLLEILKSKIL